MSKPEITFQRIELTYFKDGMVEDVLIKDVKPITSIKRKGVKENAETAKLEKIKIDVKKNPEAKVEQRQKQDKDVVAEAFEDFQQKDSDAIGSAPKDATAREDYCLKVREKIKSILEKNGKHFIREGDVYVRFIINRDGTLNDLMLYRKSSKGMHPLEKIAINSIEEASPFPPFDNSIKETSLPFDLPIRFTLHP